MALKGCTVLQMDVFPYRLSPVCIGMGDRAELGRRVLASLKRQMSNFDFKK